MYNSDLETVGGAFRQPIIQHDYPVGKTESLWVPRRITNYDESANSGNLYFRITDDQLAGWTKVAFVGVTFYHSSSCFDKLRWIAVHSDTVMEQITLSTNGFRFSALAEGNSSGPLVLFLHGFPDFADCWLPVMHSIANEGYRTVALNQRGYCATARPANVADYMVPKLVSDVLGFADALGTTRFHLVGHDWGGLLGWQVAALHPERLLSLSVLSTPHPAAMASALQTDPEQQKKSQYIQFFRMPGNVAESFLLADDSAALRRVYEGKLSESRIEENVRRFSEPGALTAALNWYRALDRNARFDPVSVQSLFIWGSADLALGEVAATATAGYVKAPYCFERLDGKSHWLQDEIPGWLSTRLLEHFRAIQR